MVGEGEPLLLIHGLGACMEYWYKNIPALSQHYRVIAFDLPGFGLSDKPKADYGAAYYADFLKALYGHFKLAKASLVGHSLGGGIALQFALEHPQRVKQLFLLNNIGFARQLSISFRLLTIPFLRDLLMQFSKKQFANNIRGHVFNPASLSDGFIDVLYPMMKDKGTQKALLYILANNVNLCGIKESAIIPTHKHINKLNGLPITILWGKEDEVLPYEANGQAIKEFLPYVPLITLDQCGHLSQLEQPDTVNQYIIG